MERHYTALYQNKGDHYIGWVEEVPGANTQGATIDEVKNNLKEALSLTLRANRTLLEKEVGIDVQREPLTIHM
ncbi:HicB family protein [bacterium]|jgi:predicted RNase H-like HicB family nuclease|nr:HicB family protein [bacterium]MDP6571671.1 type II toxin-antitoxin system HicB family antitoxin [Patescibacteria group bacterium]|tara:strand:+ start:887 stop:1105 length:219 start_codon:yes stop_codon:yes gene_type:complete